MEDAMRMWKVLAIVLVLTASACAEDPFTRTEDVVYGRSYGTALTLDVFKPSVKPNGAAIIMVVSGGWHSNHDVIGSPMFISIVKPMTKRGYTVFAVCHGCQPKFQIPEIVENINRAVRFIRYHAKDYGIDPNRIGITGASAGGHLSLMQGLAPQSEKSDANDPIEQVSSKVQAVGCFFPPTDFFNYGKEGENALGVGILKDFAGAFDFHELNPKTRKLEPVTDEKRREEIGKAISPFYHCSADDPPTMIAHGDIDKLVPIQQAQIVIDKLKDLKVPAELVTRAGGDHGWKDMKVEWEKIADWFDRHLKAK
jgi:acetyl esterase/lipase